MEGSLLGGMRSAGLLFRRPAEVACRLLWLGVLVLGCYGVSGWAISKVEGNGSGLEVIAGRIGLGGGLICNGSVTEGEVLIKKVRWGFDRKVGADLRWVPPGKDLQLRWLRCVAGFEEAKDEGLRAKTLGVDSLIDLMMRMDEQGRLSLWYSIFIDSLWYSFPKSFSNLADMDMNWYSQIMLVKFSDNRTIFTCVWPWLYYDGEFVNKSPSGKIKDDLRWVPPWCVLLSGSDLSKFDGFPLVQAGLNGWICLIEDCLELVDYVNLGKAMQFANFKWTPRLYSAVELFSISADRGMCSKDWVLKPPSLFTSFLVFCVELLGGVCFYFCFGCILVLLLGSTGRFCFNFCIL